MADIASIRAPHVDRTEGHDGTIMLLAAAAVLAILLAIAVLNPSGTDPGPEYISTMFGF
jgi:hypothetical protein